MIFPGVSVTGTSALCGLGLDKRAIWQKILEDQSCLHQGLGPFSAAQMEAVDAELQAKAEVGREPACGLIAKISWIAAREAMNEAGWRGLEDGDGLILATTTGQILHWERELMRGLKENDLVDFLRCGGITTPGRSLRELQSLLGFRGPSLMVASACSAATQALALAAMWVNTGRVRRCLVGGSEVLTQLSLEGFRGLGLISAERPRPFDRTRHGINLSEAAAFFCIESIADAGPRTRARLSGFGTTSDAYHLTAPHPEGRGCADSMMAALDHAGLKPADIDWIHAHGTGSTANDRSEGLALHRVFHGSSKATITSTKAYHGHALGAAGALESVLCVMALEDQRRLNSLGFSAGDEDLDLPIQRVHEKTAVRHVLKNSLGFGGINASLIFSRADIPSRASALRFSPSFNLDVHAVARPTPEGTRILRDGAAFRKATHAMAAAAEAIEDLLLQRPEARALLARGRLGFIFGSSMGEIETTRDFLAELARSGTARPFLFQISSHNSTTGFLAQHFGLVGPCLTVTNEYQTAETALEIAWNWLENDLCDAALVVAGDYGLPGYMDLTTYRAHPALQEASGTTAVLVAHGPKNPFSSPPVFTITELDYGRVAPMFTPTVGAFYDSDTLERIVRAAAEGAADLDVVRPDGTRTHLRF